jgi:NAD+ synthase (glutamine-hydrolysing)
LFPPFPRLPHGTNLIYPLTGTGLDSSTVLLFVYGMAKLVISALEAGDKATLADLRRVTGMADFTPTKPEEILSVLLTTCYMGTVNSSDETRSRAKRLAERLGSFHYDASIDEAVSAYMSIVKSTLNFTPRYGVEGGSHAENLALQNIQARNRMVTQYTFSQLVTTARGLPRAGAALLVLSSGNVVRRRDWFFHATLDEETLADCVCVG